MTNTDEYKDEYCGESHGIDADNTAHFMYHQIKNLKAKFGGGEVHMRWVWELLQNAYDARKSGDNSLIVVIEYSREEGRLVFLHNGREFKKNEIAHLIKSGTSKDENDETTQGKFGRGFLTTHLLSSKVNISGPLRASSLWFDFTLERNDASKSALSKSLKQSENRFINSICSIKPSSIPDSFTTRFMFPIMEDAEESARVGIRTLEQWASYVIVFNREFSEINIEMPDKIKCFKGVDDPTLVAPGIQQITVVEGKDDAKVAYLLAQNQQETSVAVPMQSNADNSICLSVEYIPRLFADFPMVGTDTFNFPAVINNPHFSSEPDRDSVPLDGNETSNIKNRGIVKEACTLLVSLIEFAASKGWNHVYQWAAIPFVDHLTIQTGLELKKCIRDLITEICQTPVVVTEIGQTKALKEACVPLAENEDRVKELWDLLNDTQEYREKLPRHGEVTGWYKVIKSWAEVNGCEISSLPDVGVIHGRKLVSDIANAYSNLKDLQDVLQEGVCAVKWLDRLYRFLKKDQLSHNVIHDFAFVPNQVGEFHYLKELSLDKSGDNELQCIDKLLGKKIRKQLCHTGLTSLENENGVKELHDESVVKLLIKEIREQEENTDKDFKRAVAKLFAWVVTSNQKNYWQLLPDVPIFTKDGKFYHALQNTIQNDKPLLAPVCAWPKDLQGCKDIFPPDRILADDFFTEVNDSEVWKHLDEKDFVRRDLIIKEKKTVNSQDFLLLGELGEDDKFHESDEAAFVTNIVERVEVMKRVKGNPNYAPPFWQLLTRDGQGLEVRKATCTSCETLHEFEYYPAEWLMRVREDKWIRGKDGGYAIPTASSLAQMLRDNKLELKFLTESPVSNKLMAIIGVQQPDLRLEFIAEDKEKRDEAIYTVTAVYDKPKLMHRLREDEKFPDELEELLDTTEGDLNEIKAVAKDLKEDKKLSHELEQRRKARHNIRQNRDLGKEVEKIVGDLLDGLEKPFNVESIEVESTHKGSDYVITLEINQDNRNWWIEVKSARTEYIKMSFEQTQKALYEKENFLLCVVPISESLEFDSESVRRKMRFIKNISRRFEDRVSNLCESIEKQKVVKAKTSEDISPGVKLEFEAGKAEIRIHKSIWESEEAFPLKNLIEKLK